MRLPIRVEYDMGIPDITQHGEDLDFLYDVTFRDGDEILDAKEAFRRVFEKASEEEKEILHDAAKMLGIELDKNK